MNGAERSETFRGIQRHRVLRRKGHGWHSSMSLPKLGDGESHSVSKLMDGANQTNGSVKTKRVEGSSVDLTPTLLSIYDSIASGNNNGSDDESDKSEISNQSKHSGQSTNRTSAAPAIKVESSKNLSKMETQIEEVTDGDEVDSKKRPLSASSISSASSSSLPRYRNKRLNLAEQESGKDSPLDIEKLENLTYIDDIEDDECNITSSEMENNGSESNDAMDALINNAVVCKDITFDEDKNISISNVHESESGKSYSPEKLVPNQPQNHIISPVVTIFEETEASPKMYISRQNLQLSPSPMSPPHHASTQQSLPSPPPGPICKLPFATSTPQSQYVTHGQRVVAEIVDTEKTYVRNLKEIKEGYMEYLINSPDVKFPAEERDCLFGNLLEIYEFSVTFLEKLEFCEYDPVKVANCFVLNNSGFTIYGQYCTNYPSAVAILTKVMIDPVLSEVFKERQLALGHALPMGAYLLKPVQRILKYHLLLQNLLKHYGKSENGYEDMQKALNHMTSMAQHINEMKRKHEHAVRVQEIQSQLEDYDGEDLTRLGELVLEGSFRIFGAKTSRQVFLFEKGVVISKRKEDGMLSCKGFIQCFNLMLVESIPKEPVSFQIIPFDNPRGHHTLQSRNLDQKRHWCQEIKRLILESYKGKIPEKVKHLVMQLGKSKEEEDYANVEPSRRHHGHNVAPEYLERRQRLRRKSGAPISDMLKNQKRGHNQRRSQSVSPNASPTPGRRRITPLLMSETVEEDVLEPESPQPDVSYISNSYDSRDTTLDDQSFASHNSVGESRHVNMLYQLLPMPFQKKFAMVGRSHSFNTAIKKRPLGSVDFGSCSHGSENDVLSRSCTEHNSEGVFSRHQSEIFRLSSRYQSTLSHQKDESNCDSFVISNGDPNISTGAKTENSVSIYDACNMCEKTVSINDQNHPRNSVSGHTDNIKGTTVNVYGSLPVLTNFNKSPTLEKSKSFRHVAHSAGQKNETFGSQSKPIVQTSKKIIDTKPYFAWDKSKFKLVDQQPNNLINRPRMIPAMHEPFFRRSTENLAAKKMGPKSISLTKPLSFRNSSVDIYQPKLPETYINCHNVKKPSDDPWVPKIKPTTHFRKETDWRKLKAQTAMNEAMRFSKDNLNWVVYANRNSLPITGFTEESNLFKYCTPPRTAMVPPGSKEFRMKYPEHCKDVHSARISEKPISHPKNRNSSCKKLNDPKYNDQHRPVLTRSNSTPLSVAHEKHPFHHNRTASMDTNTVQESERMVPEMEDYIKESTSKLDRSESALKFLTSLPSSDTEEAAEKSNRSSCISTLSTSSYDSQGSYSGNTSADSLVVSLKNKLQNITAKLKRRSVDSNSKEGSPAPSEEKREHDKQKPDGENLNRHKCSAVNLTRFHSIKVKLPESETFRSKKRKEPLLSSILLEGEPGSSTIGSRLADPFPGHYNPTLSLPRHFKKLTGDNISLSSYELSSKETSPEPHREIKHVSNLPSIHNQQSDSAVSIQSELNDNISSHDSSQTKPRHRSLSGSSAESVDSFYERRLSVALDNGEEEFRDSAVYCEMEVDNINQHYQECVLTHPPIKAYVKQLEQQRTLKVPKIVNVSTREPGVIRQRLKSLHLDPEPRHRGSRSLSEERKPCRYFSDIKVSVIEKPSSSQMYSLKKQVSEKPYRSRSSTPNRGELRPAFSTGRLDQLGNNIENLVIMKGWVRQLINKFQKQAA